MITRYDKDYLLHKIQVLQDENESLKRDHEYLDSDIDRLSDKIGSLETIIDNLVIENNQAEFVNDNYEDNPSQLKLFK